ncbi:MAG: hypothetical protein HY465_01195 [Deltaproteobacteria bacterium]|nr:hypothetical protein [Deltaproteobacteria bacterium]
MASCSLHREVSTLTQGKAMAEKALEAAREAGIESVTSNAVTMDQIEGTISVDFDGNEIPIDDGTIEVNGELNLTSEGVEGNVATQRASGSAEVLLNAVPLTLKIQGKSYDVTVDGTMTEGFSGTREVTRDEGDEPSFPTAIESQLTIEVTTDGMEFTGDVDGSIESMDVTMDITGSLLEGEPEVACEGTIHFKIEMLNASCTVTTDCQSCD